MTPLSLKERIRKYFEGRPGMVIASGELQRIAAQSTTFTPSNVSRRLRELENDGFLKVEYKKNHAYYSLSRPTLSL